jgi:hypothetical protein
MTVTSNTLGTDPKGGRPCSQLSRKYGDSLQYWECSALTVLRSTTGALEIRNAPQFSRGFAMPMFLGIAGRTTGASDQSWMIEITGGRAALMRINIWIVLVVLIALFAVTRLLRYQQDTPRICADDPSASVCGQ